MCCMLLLERCPVPLAMQLHRQGTVVASVCGKAALCAFVTPWHLDILLFTCCWYCWASDYRKCLLWLSRSVCCTCGRLHVCIVRCLRSWWRRFLGCGVHLCLWLLWLCREEVPCTTFVRSPVATGIVASPIYVSALPR